MAAVNCIKYISSAVVWLEIGPEYLSRSAYNPNVMKIWDPDMSCDSALGWLHRGYGDGCLSWVTISTLGHLQIEDRIDRLHQYEIIYGRYQQ